MSRRRKVHLHFGRVELLNFPKELADEVETYLKEFSKDKMVATVINNVKYTVPGEMTGKTVTLQHNTKENVYQLVYIEYNGNTKEAKVVEVKNVGTFKVDALNNLKLEMFKMGLI